MPREISRSDLTLSDDWGEPFPVFRGQTITAIVKTERAQMQLSASQPPNPPIWSEPVTLEPGEYSRARQFGYVRFRNATAGLPAGLSFWAYAD